MSNLTTSRNKRRMIQKSHTIMIVIIFGGALLSSLSIMTSFFLVKRLMHNQTVIAKQGKTIDDIAKNYKSIQQVDKSIKALSANQHLLGKKIYNNETALQVILDALPDRANTPALGESLRRIILNVPEVEIEQLSLTKSDEETTPEFAGLSSVAYNTEYSDVKDPSIYFRIKISGTILGLNQVLKNLEKSIRPMFADRIEFQSGSQDKDDRGKKIAPEKMRHWLSISARSFYGETVEPKMNTEIVDDTVKAKTGTNTKKTNAKDKTNEKK